MVRGCFMDSEGAYSTEVAKLCAQEISPGTGTQKVPNTRYPKNRNIFRVLGRYPIPTQKHPEMGSYPPNTQTHFGSEWVLNLA